MVDSGTVFIVDDNDDFRSSVAWMLRGEGYRTVEFACPKKAISALQLTDVNSLQRCCILLDVRMPAMNGLEFHEELRTLGIVIPIVYMTGHGDVALAVEAMKKGAVTMLEKPLAPEQLAVAINAAISESLLQRPVDKVVDVSSQEKVEFLKLLESLTPREEQVLNAMVKGRANKVIAHELDISVRTVEVHRARLMKKLHVRSASELIKMVMVCH